MNERYRGEPQNEPTIQVEVGQIFLPFRSINKFEDFDLNESYDNEEYAEVISQDILFKGIEGEVCVLADPDPEPFKAETPLGQPKLTYTFSKHEDSIMEAPCILRLYFSPRDMKQYNILRNYQAQFFINDEVYSFDCDGFENPRFVFSEFEAGETPDVYDEFLKDRNRRKKNVLLPLDLGLLKTIRMRICEYDNDDKKKELEHDFPPPERRRGVFSRHPVRV